MKYTVNKITDALLVFLQSYQSIQPYFIGIYATLISACKITINMYILEIPDASIRQKALLEITQSIYNKEFTTIDDGYLFPGFFYVDHSNKTKTEKISIEDISGVKKVMALLSDTFPKVIIIENAQHLTHEAQNSLLKNLEEETQNTITILATSDRKLLLATILSRGMHITINDISLIHPSIKQEKFQDLVYNMGKINDLAYIEEFLALSLYDAFRYIASHFDKQKSRSLSQKEDSVESFLLDLLSYYETFLTKADGAKYKDMILLIENGVKKVRKGVNARTVLEYLILAINHE